MFDLFPSVDIQLGLVPLRVLLGIIMMDSGIGKWRRGINGTGDWFESLGFPFPQNLARFVATLETICGLMLVIGLLTPVAGLLIAINMTVATFVQKFKLGAPFQGGDVQGYELDIVLAVSALTIAFTGPGVLSVDSLFFGN